jgi:hypothetical protein
MTKPKPAPIAKPCCRKVLQWHRKDLDRHHLRHLEGDDWRAGQVELWVKSGDKAPVFAFTSGNERQIAYTVQAEMEKLIEHFLRAAGISPKRVPPSGAFNHWGLRAKAALEAIRKKRRRP